MNNHYDYELYHSDGFNKIKRLNNFFGRQIKSNGIMLKMPFMGTIAKGFIFRMSATAYRNHFPFA
jgi:hypothetical protein